MHWALLWLAVTELRPAGLRSGLTALALALAILTVSVLDQQSKIRQDTILQDYEAGGAGTFLAELHTAEHEIDPVAGAIGHRNRWTVNAVFIVGTLCRGPRGEWGAT